MAHSIDESFYDESENKSDELYGITGKVSKYTYTGMSYPCIVLVEYTSIPKHKLKIISNMVKSGDPANKDTTLYIQEGGKLFKIGSLAGTQIMGLLDLLGTEGIDGFLSSQEKLEGSMLYTLSMSY